MRILILTQAISLMLILTSPASGAAWRPAGVEVSVDRSCGAASCVHAIEPLVVHLHPNETRPEVLAHEYGHTLDFSRGLGCARLDELTPGRCTIENFADMYAACAYPGFKGAYGGIGRWFELSRAKVCAYFAQELSFQRTLWELSRAIAIALRPPNER